MKSLGFRTVALAAIAALALIASGCGGDSPQEAEQKQVDQQVEKASNSVHVNPNADPATQKAQRALAEKARKQKAQAIAEAKKVAPEGRSDLRCPAYGIADNIRPTGHNCAEAKALIKAGGDDWVALPSGDTKKIHGLNCTQVDVNKSRINIRCYDISGQITFDVPTG